MAVIKALECFNDGYDWIVDIDLQSFFEEVNQDNLIGIIRRAVKDGDLVSLIRMFLQSGVMEKGIIQETKKGKSQVGNLLPLLSTTLYFSARWLTYSAYEKFKSIGIFIENILFELI